MQWPEPFQHRTNIPALLTGKGSPRLTLLHNLIRQQYTALGAVRVHADEVFVLHSKAHNSTRNPARCARKSYAGLV
jgi:aromatic ring-opening dioxygenase catalytic subunit (LigB family)